MIILLKLKYVFIVFWSCSYILHVIRPANSTPISCFKLLIAIAHSDANTRIGIIKNKDLLWSLTKSFLPSLSYIGMCKV